MAVKTAKQVRQFVAAWMASLFPGYTVFNSRIRQVAAGSLPMVVVGITEGSENDAYEESLTLRVQITHGAKTADFDDVRGPDLAIFDRVDDDLMTLRNALNQSSVTVGAQVVVFGRDIGSIGNVSWDFDASADGNEMVAWVNVNIPFSRHIFWTDDVVQDDFDTVYIEQTVDVADITVESEVTL